MNSFHLFRGQSCCFPLIKPGRVTPVVAPFRALQFSVFGLGSRAYPHFCQFAHTIRDLLSDLGANELYPLSEGDELEGQEDPFRDWAAGVFQVRNYSSYHCEAMSLKIKQK